MSEAVAMRGAQKGRNKPTRPPLNETSSDPKSCVSSRVVTLPDKRLMVLIEGLSNHNLLFFLRTM